MTTYTVTSKNNGQTSTYTATSIKEAKRLGGAKYHITCEGTVFGYRYAADARAEGCGSDSMWISQIEAE